MTTMALPLDDKSVAPEAAGLQRVADLLGGDRVLRRRLRTPLDVHELLVLGLPGRALTCLIENLAFIPKTESLEKGVGMSLRTFQRHKDAPSKPLSQEQSGRTWKFAEILADATAVFGSREEAEHWLERPATGLNRQRPIDLLATPAGTKLVEDFLRQLEYGVYV
jgi:putative toxin-antitoxin system antitoxin component (TIGR02293 family)